MQISPKFSMYLNIVMVVCGVLAGMAPSAFPAYVPAGVSTDIIQTAGLVSLVWGGINTALHGMSAGTVGPLVDKVDPGKVVGGLLFFAALGTLGGSLTGCANLSATQQANLQLELALAKQFGTDAVQVWCVASGIVYVVADAETGNKATPGNTVTLLKNNAAAAAAACPMIAQVTSVKVVTTPPAGATQSPLSSTSIGG